jgi:hypothetical protein
MTRVECPDTRRSEFVDRVTQYRTTVGLNLRPDLLASARETWGRGIA